MSAAKTAAPGPMGADTLPVAWRRRLAEFEDWIADRDADLDLAELESWRYCSVELWFERWPRPWPLAVRLAMLRRLAGIAQRWRTTLQDVPGPTYLGLWIFEPSLVETQLVAACGERALDYADRHSGLPFTGAPTLYAPALAGLADWEWVRHPDRWEWDLADVDPASRLALLRMPHRKGPGRGQMTASRIVWRGQLKSPAV